MKLIGNILIIIGLIIYALSFTIGRKRKNHSTVIEEDFLQLLEQVKLMLKITAGVLIAIGAIIIMYI
ncbi:hypothetical protein EDC19_2183 [Natranaerovirga hydrolytica]|uniref:Immunity protein 17 of polymorphic toxin system n=1 Tax=Natranaerovirga hydrolytica TaxID=680378 RepID=A0A4R1MIC9_9FIRM|nr:hypothetical protein [Natranaerovirga hydrolytica]TCK92448.1 hypothetical protein EDC19_2183 [Natranaerovirga hydrolytica]